MNLHHLLIASAALLLAPLAPAAHAQAAVTCQACVTLLVHGHSSTTCHPATCPAAGSTKIPFPSRQRVQQGSLCSVRISTGVAVNGGTAGKTCLLYRAIMAADLTPAG